MDCKGKFSSRKVGRSGAQLPLFTRNPPQVLQLYYKAMSFECVTYIIIILQLNMSHTFTVNIEYGKVRSERSLSSRSCDDDDDVMSSPRDEAAVL